MIEMQQYNVVTQCAVYDSNLDEQILNRDENLEDRVVQFFESHAPHYKSRIPIIMEAYREWPLMLFGDLDNNYSTKEANPVEKEAWSNETLERKAVRVQVAQDYIYRAMNQQHYVHPRETMKLTQAKLGTSVPTHTAKSVRRSSSKSSSKMVRSLRSIKNAIKGVRIRSSHNLQMQSPIVVKAPSQAQHISRAISSRSSYEEGSFVGSSLP